MLNIEKLKELKQQVFDDFQLYEVKMQNSFEESMREVTPTGEMDEAGNDLTSLIDAEIARQSVKSEEVQEAIDILQAIRPSEKEIKSGEYPDVADAIDIAITTLQAYKPWVSVEDRLPEDRRAVLVWEPMYKNIFTMYWEEGQWFFFGGGGQLNCEITHWKPLPEPPKGE